MRGSRAVPAGRSPGGIVAALMHDQGVRAQFGEVGVAKRVDDRYRPFSQPSLCGSLPGP